VLLVFAVVVVGVLGFSERKPCRRDLVWLVVLPKHRAYRGVASEAILDRLIGLAAELRGLRLLQLNATCGVR
jgi:hypothetical protein